MASSFQGLQDKIEITASRECFIALRTKSFTIMPDCLANAIKKELTATAREIFRELYGLAEKTWNSKEKTSPVIISAKVLAAHNFKSERTIKRRLAELRDKGFIKIRHRFNKQVSVQISNAIWPVLPASLRQELLKSPDRKNVKKKALEEAKSVAENDYQLEKNKDVMVTPLNIDEPQSHAYQANGAVKDLEQIGSIPEQQAYVCYTKQVVELQTKGVGIAKANMAAYQQLSQEQKFMFAKYIVREAKKETIFATKQALAISVTQGDKMGTHKIYNHDLVNSNISVDNYTVKTSAKVQGKVVVNLNEKITPDFIAKEICKMKGNAQIPQIVFERGRTITDIVLEVQFHVKHRDLNKTSTSLHALNAAKSLLRKGLWKTPIKYVYARNAEAIARERAMAAEKARELVEIRRFINHAS